MLQRLMPRSRIAFRIERQNLLHLQRSVTRENQDKRGSMEETRRILQEIDRINLSLGYTKRMTLAFPRVASGEGYFYPRQQFRPEFLTKQRVGGNQNNLRMTHQRAIYPFNNQNYFYPTPYLQAPNDGKAHAFKSNKYFYPLIYAPINVMPDADGSIRLGTIVVLPEDDTSSRESKSYESTGKPQLEKKVTKVKVKQEQSLIDQIVNYVPDALGLTDEDEDERQESVVSTTRLPAIKNDKFLNLSVKKHPQDPQVDDDRKAPPPPPFIGNRAFNFSNPIEKLQNLTKQFTHNQKNEMLRETTANPSSSPSSEDLEEVADEVADDREEEKSPFGFAFGPKQQLQTYKEGGLIIQRLRVRHGGIAIAGPGGVATVNSFVDRAK